VIRVGSEPAAAAHNQADQGANYHLASKDRRDAAALRTKAGAPQKHREANASPEAVRQRRSTANRVLTILKAALNHAHRKGRCANHDAWRTVRAFREADAAPLRYLSDDAARRLTNACPADFRGLVTAALLTGCRYGELVAMTGEDFNPDAGTIRVHTSKSGKPRHVGGVEGPVGRVGEPRPAIDQPRLQDDVARLENPVIRHGWSARPGVLIRRR
jgi:integrase